MALLPVLGQPFLHPGDFLFLRGDDVLREFPDFRIGAVLEHHFRHVDRALMVRDHAAHEIGVGVAAKGDSHIPVHFRVRRLERLGGIGRLGGGLRLRAMRSMIRMLSKGGRPDGKDAGQKTPSQTVSSSVKPRRAD